MPQSIEFPAGMLCGALFTLFVIVALKLVGYTSACYRNVLYRGGRYGVPDDGFVMVGNGRAFISRQNGDVECFEDGGVCVGRWNVPFTSNVAETKA